MKIELNSLGCCSKLQQRQARSILFSFSILIRFDKKYISTCGLNIFLKISPLERYISFAYRLNWYTSLEEIFFKVDRQHDRPGNYVYANSKIRIFVGSARIRLSYLLIQLCKYQIKAPYLVVSTTNRHRFLTAFDT